MNLADLYQSLSYGELSNLAMAGDANGTIAVSARPRIVHYTNEALLRLYARFLLKEEDLLLEMHEDISLYWLLPRFAVNYVPEGPADTEPVRYILDLPEAPFRGNLIKVLSVFDSTGCKLPLNDDEQPLSLFTPQANLLQVPHPRPEGGLAVLYQARHPKIQGDLEETIEVPEILLGALTSYIAYKVFSHMNTQDSTAKAQEHMAVYEAICAEAVEKDLVNTSISSSNARFHQRGWV